MGVLGLILVAWLGATNAGAASPGQSKIWPMCDEGAAWMLEGMPNSANIGYPVGESAPRQLPAGYQAVVEVPAYVELYSYTLSYSREMAAPEVQEVTRAGRPYRRYRFAPLTYKNYDRWASFFTHWLPRPTPQDRQDPGEFVWHFETPEGPEPERALPIKLLPELPAFTAPQRFQVRLWQSSILNVQPDKLRPVLRMLQRAGFNTIPWWESPLENLLKAGAREMGLKIAADQAGHYNWPELAKPSPQPEYQNRDHEGKAVAEQDPQWIIDTNGAPWENDLKVCSRLAAQLDVLSQDIEWNVGGFHTGFSPAGIRAFAQAYQLDPAALTPQLIWARYRKQWYDFRAAQTLRLVQFYYRAAKAGNPQVQFQFLPGSPYSTTDANMLSEMVPLEKDALGRMIYLIFPFPLRRLPEAMDVIMPMWYGHGVSQTRDNLQWSRALSAALPVPLMPCLLGQGREFYYPGGDPGEVLRAMNLATALGGARGVCYWLGEFSPLQLSWLARGFRELAQVEDILFTGKADPAGVALTPLPKRTFTLLSGTAKRVFPVPDFNQVVLYRAYAHGARRLIGLINLDTGTEVYYRLRVSGLPRGAYRLYDVAAHQLIGREGNRPTFSEQDLKAGIVLRTAPHYGVSLYLIQPASLPVPPGARQVSASALLAAYAKYKEPDTTGAVLAERAGMSIRYDIVGSDKAKAVLIETPQQQVWVRLQNGGVISDWKIKERNRTVVRWTPPYGGAALDLFWSPADAHWSGDESTAYELVDAKIHGGKAYLRLRQKKHTPSLQGLVVTKTIAVPADRTDLEITVQIENPGPAPEVGFSYWSHHMFQLGEEELARSQPRQYPQVLMRTQAGVTEAPLQEIVWAKPGAPYLPGNESFEKAQRNGETTGDWIVQRNPVTKEAVLCQIDEPSVTQFYSWRDRTKPDELSIEWMYPYVKLPASGVWQTKYVLRYLKEVEKEAVEGKLLKKVNE